MPFKYNPFTSKLDLVDVSGGSSTTINSKATIVQSSPAEATLAFATDTEEFLVYDGSAWHVSPLKLANQPANSDAGAISESSKYGYGTNYILEKYLLHTVVGYSDREVDGSIRLDNTVTPKRFEMYNRGRWNIIFLDLEVTDNNGLIHVPFEDQIEVRSGNSVRLSASGYPLIMGYQRDAGSFQAPPIVGGRTF